MSQNYTPTVWVNNKTVGTATVMNNMEKGIYEAHTRIDDLTNQINEANEELHRMLDEVNGGV